MKLEGIISEIYLDKSENGHSVACGITVTITPNIQTSEVIIVKKAWSVGTKVIIEIPNTDEHKTENLQSVARKTKRKKTGN